MAQETMDFGRDALSGTSEFAAAMLEAGASLFNIDVEVPTIPWRGDSATPPADQAELGPVWIGESPSRTKTARECFTEARQAYREFDYHLAVLCATQALYCHPSTNRAGAAYLLRGACQYLLNNTSRAGEDFNRAKSCGVTDMDSRVFPLDMVRFFEGMK